MDIHSPRTRKLLRDPNVSKALNDVKDRFEAGELSPSMTATTVEGQRVTIRKVDA